VYPPVNQDGFASGTKAQIDPVLLRRDSYQSWARLPAVAIVRIIMVAGRHVV
jgi:hypothetical protein